MSEYEIECEECNWMGDVSHLVCSDEDAASDKELSEIKFNRCPECGSTDIVDIDEEEDEEDGEDS